jgi:2-succinyl-5-enolpyruvyl-6-hydroxy-3-cyclohexene-1-carboxylate synthase
VSTNQDFASTLFAELVRSGVRHACVCPGSRSTPLTAAAVSQTELRCWSHVDERAAAFFALGLARASRAPVALICTSGTAAANFHPAVVEAHHARVPLVVLTADRPPELRDWGAGQTIDQLGLYGSSVRWFVEAPVPIPGDACLRHARALGARAVAMALGRPAGPVHLNLPFREPLAPDTPVEKVLDETPVVERWTPTAEAGLAPDAVDAIASALRGWERGIVACGPLDARDDEVRAIARLAQTLGWPLLAEPTSQLRCGPASASAPVVATADLLLRDPTFAECFAPECVLRFGDAPTSKSFRLWLERTRPARVLHVDPDGVWHDPSHLASDVLRCEPRALCEALLERLEPPAQPSAWLRDFLAADRAATAALDAELPGDPMLHGPGVVRELAGALPDGAQLYVSNSLAVRDIDAYLPASERALRVLCNRGANGIDGILSSALGAAAAEETAHTVLLTGDLAFLHDAGGLLAAHRHRLRATIVVLDDDGGAIFSLLPIATHGEAVGFEEHFRARHGLDLAGVARAYGAHVTKVSSSPHLSAALKEAFAMPGLSVVHVPVDAERAMKRRREIEAQVAQALVTR